MLQSLLTKKDNSFNEAERKLAQAKEIWYAREIDQWARESSYLAQQVIDDPESSEEQKKEALKYQFQNYAHPKDKLSQIAAEGIKEEEELVVVDVGVPKEHYRILKEMVTGRLKIKSKRKRRD